MSCNVVDGIVTDPCPPINLTSPRDVGGLEKLNAGPASGTKGTRSHQLPDYRPGLGWISFSYDGWMFMSISS